MKHTMWNSPLALLLLLPVIVELPCRAQEKKFAGAGVVELSGSVSFASLTPVSNGETGDATSIFSFGPQIAYFLTDGIAIGFNPGITLIPGISIVTPSEGENTTVTQLFIFPGGNILLPSGSTALFAEVPLGYTSISSGDNKASGFSWGVKAGVKIVPEGQVLVSIFGEYLVVTLNPEDSTSERNGFNYVLFGVSIGGFF